MKQQVKQTSIAAYHEKAATRQTQRERVARYILQCTKEGRRTWRRDVARALQMETSTVAGRIKEIEVGGAEIDGVCYMLSFFAARIKDPVTGVSSEAFGLVIDNTRQLKLALA
jgi:hypothetical protein